MSFDLGLVVTALGSLRNLMMSREFPTSDVFPPLLQAILYLRYRLTDVPPQTRKSDDSVFRPDQSLRTLVPEFPEDLCVTELVK